MAVDKWCHNVKCRLFSKRVRVGAASKICPFRGGGCGKALFAVKPRGGAAKVVALVPSAYWFASGMWWRVTATVHMYFVLVRARRILARACGDGPSLHHLTRKSLVTAPVRSAGCLQVCCSFTCSAFRGQDSWLDKTERAGELYGLRMHVRTYGRCLCMHTRNTSTASFF